MGKSPLEMLKGGFFSAELWADQKNPERHSTYNYRAPLKTPFCILGGSFAYKKFEKHPVFQVF